MGNDEQATTIDWMQVGSTRERAMGGGKGKEWRGNTHTRIERRREKGGRESDRSEREGLLMGGGDVPEKQRTEPTYLEDEGKFEREGYTLWLV